MKQKFTITTILILIFVLFIAISLFAETVVALPAQPVNAAWLAAIGSVMVAVIGGFIKLMTVKWTTSMKDIQLSLIKEFGEFKLQIFKKVDDLDRLSNDRFKGIETTLADHGKCINQLMIDVEEVKECKTDKERRAKEFDSDWKGIVLDFEKLKSMELVSVARCVKEYVKQFSMEVTAWNYAANSIEDKKAIIDSLQVRGNYILDQVAITTKSIMGSEFITTYSNNNTEVRNEYERELIMIVSDTINHKQEAIHMASRKFMRRSLNTLLITYQQAH